MPHIVLNGSVDLEKIRAHFQPIFEKDSSIIRLKEMYVASSKNNALIHTITIEQETQEFFIELLSSKDKTTIRLYPLTDPKKTDSVKISMALLCDFIKKLYPDLPIGKTNLQDYLSKVLVSC